MKQKKTSLKSKALRKRPEDLTSPPRASREDGNGGTVSEQADYRVIVGLGASAGGLQAFKTFFAHMPPNSGMTFVLIQHLDPHHPSMLAELLKSCTTMPVSEAVDGSSLCENHIYVIPPNATLTIAGGKLRVTKPAPSRENRWPIDTFFSSLAEDQGDKGICIVLSGGGSDGTKGLQAIKEHGGLTIAQASGDENAVSGMPSSATASGFVDEILAVEHMPSRLIAYYEHCRSVLSQKDPDGLRLDAADQLPTICRLLRSKTGHDFSQYKNKTLIRRVQRRMQVLHIKSTADYVEKLRQTPLEIGLLFQDFLISVTHFFRDPEAFEILENQVIPKLFQDKGEGDTVRVWVPGCATGPEVYSIAILLKEAAGKLANEPKLQIFATDIDEPAVRVARTARYVASQVAHIPADRLERWFNADGNYFVLGKAIREICIFSVHNVIKDPPFSKLDLISCRNLLIYFGTELQDRTIRTFHYALRPRGYLFLGASESVTRYPALFERLTRKHRIFERRDAPAYLPVRSAGTNPTSAPGGVDVSAQSAEKSIERSARRLMAKYVPAYVVVNRNHDVVRFSGRTDEYLRPSPGAATLNLFSLLHGALRAAARAALNEVRITRKLVMHEGLPIEIDGCQQFVDLGVEPIPDSAEGHCVVAFFDRKSGPKNGDPTETNAGPVAELERKLKETRDNLGVAVDQLESSNEELTSANEEFHSVNEELQSTNEELETSKEEMQSINEELQTVNAELNSKNDALMHVNSDLQNLLDSTQIATLFLDRNLCIRNFTPAVVAIFHVRDSDRGRPVAEIVSRISYKDLKRDATRVMNDLATVERSVYMQDDGLSFLMRLRPYRTLNDVIDGVVITFTDITEFTRHEHERSRLAAIVDSSNEAIISVDTQGLLVTWNRGAERLFGYSAEEILGRSVALLDAPDGRSEEAELLANILHGGHISSYDTVRLRKDGSPVDISITVSPIKTPDGKVLGTSRIINDATPRKIWEAALVKSEERYRTLFAEIDEAFSIIEKVDEQDGSQSDYRILVANPSFTAQSGVGNVIGKTIREAFPQDSQDWIDTYDAILKTGVAARFEHELQVQKRILGLYAFRLNDSTQRRVALLFADITERKRADRRQKLLMDELNHRVKNTLATVQSIATKSLKGQKGQKPIGLQMFTARLTALSRTHNLLARDNWEAVSLREILAQEFEPYRSPHLTSFTIAGPEVRIKSQAALALGMAIHELITNAAKYGALSRATGTVQVKWSIVKSSGRATLKFTWSETGGPLVKMTEYKGFGSIVLQRSLAFDLDAEVKMNFAPSGLVCTLAIPLSEIEVRVAETADESQKAAWRQSSKPPHSGG